jgi:hypothetical protein
MAESYEERRIRMSLQDAGMVAVDRGYLYEGAGCAVRTQAVLQYLGCSISNSMRSVGIALVHRDNSCGELFGVI